MYSRIDTKLLVYKKIKKILHKYKHTGFYISATFISSQLISIEFSNSSTLVHQSSQAPIFDRSLKFFLIDISGFFPSIKKFAKTIFKIRLFSSICELLKIEKEFLLKFNTLSIALSTLSPTETNGKI